MKATLKIGISLAALTLAATLPRSIPVQVAHGKDTNQGEEANEVEKEKGEKKGDEGRIKRGFAIAPVPLDLKGKNRALVGLGSYIVNAQAGCNDCHSCPSYAPGHNPFLHQPKQFNADNYLAGGVPFGPFTSRNITPDSTTGRPANFTFTQFKLVLRTGQDLKNEHPALSDLLQVMPWPVFQSMTDRDLRAIYEYLNAIPHAEPGICAFPGQ